MLGYMTRSARWGCGNQSYRRPSWHYDESVIVPNRCSFAKVALLFQPLLDEAVIAYQQIFNHDLVSIRLLGSVARGEAIPGESDIDFMALLQAPASARAAEALQEAAEDLLQLHAVVSRVDLDAIHRDALQEVQHFILGNDSLLLYGKDDVAHGQQTMNRSHLISLVTLSAADLIRSYRTTVERLDDPDGVRRLSRVTGKDLLKCLRGVALARGAAYENRIEAIYHQVVAFVPEQRDLAEELYTCYRLPTSDKNQLRGILALAELRFR